jgi:hypothetical protein
MRRQRETNERNVNNQEIAFALFCGCGGFETHDGADVVLGCNETHGTKLAKHKRIATLIPGNLETQKY